MVGLGTTLSLISKVTGVKNFTYTAKIIPQKIGAFGVLMPVLMEQLITGTTWILAALGLVHGDFINMVK